jgi:hypothetical protein
MITKIKLIPALLILALLTTFSACEEFGFPVDESFKRLFSPVTFSSENITATSADLTFSKVPGAETYVIEFSEDSLQFTTIVRTLTVKADTLSLVSGSTSSYLLRVGDLKGATRYSARLKAISPNNETPESKWDLLTFSTKSEQIFKNVLSTDKTDYSVVLRWDASGAGVTHIMLTNKLDNSTKREDLTAADKTASMKLIEGLTGATTYTADIYNNDNKRGSITFRTNESVPSEGKVIRLTGTENLNEILAAESGDITLVLPAGSLFEASWLDPATSTTSYTLPISDNITKLTFWGVEGDVRPRLHSTAIKLGAGITELRFKNIEYYGKASTADYVLNENSTRAITKISFEDCEVHTVRGVVRMQNDANYTVLEKVLITNTIIHDIGNYGITHTGAANTKLMDLEISGSTFYNITDPMCNLKNIATSVVIDQCTFYNAFGNGRYFLQFNTTFVPEKLLVSNCVFGQMNATVLDGTQTMRATNPKLTTVFIENSYKTTDFFVHTGYPMTGISEYTGTAADLFVDPAARNFRIKDVNFGGLTTAGDPRWR